MSDARAHKTSARQDVAIEAAADALLAVCALQTGTDPRPAATRAVLAITTVYERGLEQIAEREVKER
jgi:hypothetical protein